MTTGRANRVAPDGTLHAVADRGTMFGNRGDLLSARGELVRSHRGTRAIVCVLDFTGRRREQWRPGTYTELYFLDEATALAAGHRPCRECRRDAFSAYAAAWARATGVDHPPRATEMDAVLHTERLAPDRARLPLAAVPGGAVVEADGRRWLVHAGRLRPWSFAGYGEACTFEDMGDGVVVLTPPATLAALRAGYRPQLAGDRREFCADRR